MKLLRDWLTEDDAGERYCPLQFGFVVGLFVFFGLTIYNASAFDPVTFCASLGGFLTTTGLALWANSKRSGT